jgi:hypothetical protein
VSVHVSDDVVVHLSLTRPDTARHTRRSFVLMVRFCTCNVLTSLPPARTQLAVVP